MLLMDARQRADAVGAEELPLVEHPRENAAQPLGVDDSENTPVVGASMLLAGGMNSIAQLRCVRDSLEKARHQLRYPFALLRFDDRGRAHREQTNQRSHL